MHGLLPAAMQGEPALTCSIWQCSNLTPSWDEHAHSGLCIEHSQGGDHASDYIKQEASKPVHVILDTVRATTPATHTTSASLERPGTPETKPSARRGGRSNRGHGRDLNDAFHYKKNNASNTNEPVACGPSVKRGDPCNIRGCTFKVRARGTCTRHARMAEAGRGRGLSDSKRGDPCAIRGCLNKTEARCLCKRHGRMLKQGQNLADLSRIHGKASSTKPIHGSVSELLRRQQLVTTSTNTALAAAAAKPSTTLMSVVGGRRSRMSQHAASLQPGVRVAFNASTVTKGNVGRRGVVVKIAAWPSHWFSVKLAETGVMVNARSGELDLSPADAAAQPPPDCALDRNTRHSCSNKIRSRGFCLKHLKEGCVQTPLAHPNAANRPGTFVARPGTCIVTNQMHACVCGKVFEKQPSLHGHKARCSMWAKANLFPWRADPCSVAQCANVAIGDQGHVHAS